MLASTAEAAVLDVCPPNATFGPAQSSVVGSPQRHVRAGDFNGDGVLDLAICTESSLIIETGALGGDGVVSFTVAHSFFAGQEPSGVAIADFNGDGILDLAVAALGGRIFLFRGLGSGGVGNGDFAPNGVLDISSVWGIAAGDVTGDGILDLVAGATGSAFVVYQGTGAGGVGDGGFVHLRDVPSAGQMKAVVLADLDGDGVLDIAGATEGGYLAVHKGLAPGGTPNGDFAAGIDLPAAGSTYDVAVADFNLDGIPDLVSANYTGGSVTVTLGAGGFTFHPPITHGVPGSPLGVGVADFNHDGFPDIVTAAAGSDHNFNYLPNSGDFTGGSDGFTTFLPVTYGPQRVGYGMLVADFNNDGSPDVMVPGVVESDIVLQLDNCVTSRPILTTVVVGSGSVARVPDAPDYALGTIVQLTATAAAHYQFARWSGDATGSASPIQVTMDRSKAVTATFAGITHHLVVSTTGPGAGHVDRVPDSDPVLEGSVVHLSAVPAFGSVFVSWSGDASGSVNPLDVTVNTDLNIVAAFGPDTTILPRIVSVTDVPLDQGGKVKLRWLPSSLEAAPPDSGHTVTQYFIWREIPQAAFVSAQAASTTGDGTTRSLLHTTLAARDYFWEFVVALPASRFTGYSYTAATTNDSTEHGNPFTSFLVQARTAAATQWWDSPPDSGYSVDNLSPPTPGPVVAEFGGSTNRFHWGPSFAADLASYRVYRGTSRDFTPGAANLIGAPTDTVFVDSAPGGSYYRFAAADIHGNLSHFVLVSPEGPVATLASLVTAEASADHIRLTWYVSQPGLPATLYRRTLSSDWTRLAALYADGQGFLRYADADILRGETYGYRLGIQDAGGESFFAETYVLAEDIRFAIEGLAPNPAVGGRLTVRFSLPSEAPATLELLDITGRRVDARTLSGQAGRQSVELGGGARIPPGLYWIRLRHAGREGSIRAVVLQ
jgi:hypothetical protein